MKNSRRYKRPLIVSILLSILREITIFLVWGIILFPEGSLFAKFVWTVLFCGLGMGATIGSIIVLFVVDTFNGVMAGIVTTALYALVLGLGCNFLCYELDKQFHYFGAVESGPLFLINGIGLSVVGGMVASYLLFSQSGKRLLDRLKI